MASARFENVSKSFGKTDVIREVTLGVADGEFVVLVGPSGCGKTTLLRTLAGLEAPTGGEVFIGERKVTGVPARERNVAMVFQNYALLPHMTVAENISFGMKIRKVPKAERERRTKEVAERLEMTPLLDRLPRQLSGGQRQRAAMARALARNPACLLMDEPLSNLDAQLRSQVRGEIKRLQHRLRLTTLYVTHDQLEAMTLADRVAVLRGGVIEQCASPAELYERPANLFVAGFIGHPAMNFLPARRVEGRVCVLSCGGGGVAFELPERLADKIDGETELTLGVRPRHLWPGAVQAPEVVGLPAEVTLTEPTGDETIVRADAGGPQLLALTGREGAPAEGERLTLSFSLASAHVFAAGSGRCLAYAETA